MLHAETQPLRPWTFQGATWSRGPSCNWANMHKVAGPFHAPKPCTMPTHLSTQATLSTHMFSHSAQPTCCILIGTKTALQERRRAAPTSAKFVSARRMRPWASPSPASIGTVLSRCERRWEGEALEVRPQHSMHLPRASPLSPSAAESSCAPAWAHATQQAIGKAFTLMQWACSQQRCTASAEVAWGQAWRSSHHNLANERTKCAGLRECRAFHLPGHESLDAMAAAAARELGMAACFLIMACRLACPTCRHAAKMQLQPLTALEGREGPSTRKWHQLLELQAHPARICSMPRSDKSANLVVHMNMHLYMPIIPFVCVYSCGDVCVLQIHIYASHPADLAGGSMTWQYSHREHRLAAHL